MDDSFLNDFNTTDPPVFARKSAPPAPSPPPSKDGIENATNQSGFSTPSSSLLDTSNENSSLAANSIPAHSPSPSPNVHHPGHNKPEPMETDIDDADKTDEKRSRNRSRSKRSENKRSTDVKASPDINVLLAELEKGNPPPLPLPLPPTTILPPLPPPLPPTPFPSSEGMTGRGKEGSFDGSGATASANPTAPSTPASTSSSPASSSSTSSSKKDATKKNGKMGKKQPTPANQQDSTSGSQRTSGRIPKLPKGSKNEPSNISKQGSTEGDRSTTSSQATLSQSSSTSSSSSTYTTPSSSSTASSTPQRGEREKGIRGSGPSKEANVLMGDGPNGKGNAPSNSARSAYDKRPNEQDKICMDISSFRFIPDDDQRIAVVLRKMKGDQLDRFDVKDNKKIMHQLPTIYSNDVTGIPLSEAPGASFLQESNEKFISISDFASQEANAPTVFHTITRRDAIVFIIVTRPENARGKLAWDIPTLTQCQDYSNEFISKIFNGDNLHWARTYIRSGRWGKVGTIILSTRDMEALSEFRRQFALLSYRGASFDTHPKDALTAKADVAVLLRASMKTFRTEMIPTVLFARNQELIAGSLRVLSTTFHSAEETSHKGDSKEHWRTVDLKGDEQFMRCLRFILENQPFFLGYDAVQLRGGLRPQEQNFAHTTGHKRAWADTPPPSVPLLTDPRNIQPTAPMPDENSMRGAAKRGRNSRGNRRGGRRGRGRPGT